MWGLRFRLTVFCYHFCLNAFQSKYVSILFILFSQVFDMNLLIVQFIALHGKHARSRSRFGRNMVYCAEWFNCSVNDLIYGRLPIIINSYVRNSVDETRHNRMAFMRELNVIRDSSLTLSGLLSGDELNDVISHICKS